MKMLQRSYDGRESNCVQFLEEQYVLVRQVEVSRVGGWCSAREGGHPSDWILLVLMWWIHEAMDFSYWTHVEMVQWR